jgi:hypothetical protein
MFVRRLLTGSRKSLSPGLKNSLQVMAVSVGLLGMQVGSEIKIRAEALQVLSRFCAFEKC